MQLSDLIIAIDGYSSCGKSTVAKAVARKLGLNFIDSGSMYRAVTLYFIRNQVPVPSPQYAYDSSEQYESVLKKINIWFRVNPLTGFSEVYLNDENVEKLIRSMEVSENVSPVSAIPLVRHKMVALQKSYGNHRGLVMDGRDIGTTVFPDADLKIFMTARIEVRIERRYLELISNGINISVDEVRENLIQRDFEDSTRRESPLRKADDALVLDNSEMDFEQQQEFVINEVKKLVPSASV